MAGKKIDTVLILLMQIVLIILFVIFAAYDDDYEQNSYPMFQDVHVMIFIGFGFLMTFLRRYGYSAVGFNFLLGALIIQWALLCQGFYQLNENNKMELGIGRWILSSFYNSI
jgi:ammonium transporter Rh